jgi:hypothetical protein
MRGAIPPLPQYAFIALCLVKHRDNFTFTFTYLFVHLIVASLITELIKSRHHIITALFALSVLTLAVSSKRSKTVNSVIFSVFKC